MNGLWLKRACYTSFLDFDDMPGAVVSLTSLVGGNRIIV